MSGDKFSNLLVICEDQNDFDNIAQILSHYFPNPDCQKALLISNKYYRAQINLLFKTWTQTLNSYQLTHYSPQSKPLSSENQHKIRAQEQSNQSQLRSIQTKSIKYDLMIMLVNQNQSSLINFEALDQIIQNYNPEQFVLLINTTNPLHPWAYQQTILQKCNNFIEIVKENLSKINQTRPHWARGVLLNNQQDNHESGIFSILDRIETTRWNTMVNVKKQPLQQKAPNTPKNTPNQSHINQSMKTHEKNLFNSNPQQNSSSNSQSPKPKQDKKEFSEIDQEKNDEKRFEEEMREFEDVMSQMMTFKSQSVGMKNEERKQKAEQLFANMFKGMMNFE